MATYRSLASALTTTNPLINKLVDNMKTVDNVLSYFLARAQVTDRGQIVVNRIDSIPAAQIIDCDSTITSVVGSTSTLTVNPSNYVQQFDLCTIVDDQASSFTDQLEVDSRIAVKSIAKTLGANIFTGTGTTGGVNGIVGYVGTSTATATSGSLALSDLNNWAASLPGAGMNDVYITTPAVYAKVQTLMNSAGGVTMQELANGMPTLAYHGIPFLASEYATAGTIYRIGDEGYNLVYQNKAANNVGPFNVELIGSRYDKAAQVYRLSMSMFGVSDSSQQVSRLTGA